MPHVERQGPQGVRREQAVRPQFPEHAGEQPGGLAHQGLVRRIVLRDVVAGRGRAVRTLDQETEKRLLFGGEEHGERGPAARGDPVLAAAGVHAEGDLHAPCRFRGPCRLRGVPAGAVRLRGSAGWPGSSVWRCQTSHSSSGRPRPVDRVT